MMSDSTLLPTLRQWANNIAPGGGWSGGSIAGLWYLYLDGGRSYSGGRIGVRPEELTTLVLDAEEAPGLRARVAKPEAAHMRVEALVTQCEAHARETTDALDAPAYGAGAMATMIRAAMHPTGTND